MVYRFIGGPGHLLVPLTPPLGTPRCRRSTVYRYFFLKKSHHGRFYSLGTKGKDGQYSVLLLQCIGVAQLMWLGWTGFSSTFLCISVMAVVGLDGIDSLQRSIIACRHHATLNKPEVSHDLDITIAVVSSHT